VVGTPEYMSPEQARGETLDARSDIYAMGVLLFHMMTGKVPFDSSTAFGTAFMHVNDEPTRPRLLNPGADSRLEAICLKAMRKRREDRHASARELRGELRALLGHDDAYMDESAAAPVLPSKPLRGGLLQQVESRPPRTGLVMAGVVLAASVVAGGILYPRKPAAGIVAQEPVQTARINSAVMSAAPRPAPELAEPPKVVDTTAAAGPGPGADATSAPASASPRSRGVTRVNAHVRRSGTKAHEPSLAAEDIPLVPVPGAKPDPAAADKAAPTDKPAADKPAAAPAADKAAPADKPAAAKPAATADKAAAPAEKPAAPKPAAAPKADPADAPLPNFPIPAIPADP
jgi:serine/threonine-protein kinase